MSEVLRCRTGTKAAVEQGLRPVDDHLGWIKVIAAAESMTLGASAIRAVEGEGTGLELGHADAAVGTGKARRVERLCAADDSDLHEASAELHRQADRHLQTMCDSGLHQQPVDHDLDGVILALVEANVVFEIYEFAIDTGPGEAVLDELFHLFFELAFPAADDGRQDHHAIVGSERHYALHDL